jgi:benzylsuccinate CoA-transferase BbsE subunit
MTGTADTEGAFAGLVILELGDEGTQTCGKYFADMGATVVKVEPPRGAGSRHRGPYKDDVPDVNASLHFWAHNTSKESVILDLEEPDDRAVLHSLAHRADVILEDFSPGYLDRLGIGYTQFVSIDSSLILTSVTPFGQTGPLRDWKSSDMVSWAMGGAMWLVGYPDTDIPPLLPQGEISYQAAACWAIIGTLVALTARMATGQGQHVDVSIQEACAFLVDGYDIAPYEYTGEVKGRQSGLGGDLVVTKDQKFFVPQITNVSDHRWLEFREWLKAEGEGAELHALDPDAMRADMSRLLKVIQVLAEKRTAAELSALGQSFGFTWMAANAPEELFDDEQLRFRQFFQDVAHPEFGASYLYGGPAALWSEAGWKIRSRAPRLGEHNAKWGIGGRPNQSGPTAVTPLKPER